jgi:hypothetical protein
MIGDEVTGLVSCGRGRMLPAMASLNWISYTHLHPSLSFLSTDTCPPL